ncbi:MAG: lamin tail domain-containing protein [Candidatus Firestonebacteria bacterium]|nr:lamin tail domain-containing protein [Candidatus Firestonebacteria bacterium]
MNRFTSKTAILHVFLLLFSMFTTCKQVFSIDLNIIEKNSYWTNKIIINEWVPYPDSNKNEWIELYNKSDEIIDLTGWKIADNTLKPKEIKGEIFPHDFLVLEPSPISLNNDGDIIIIIDNNDKIADYVEYGKNRMVETAAFPNSIGLTKLSLKLVIFNNPTKGTINSEEAFTLLDIYASSETRSFSPIIGEKIAINIFLTCPSPIIIKIFDQSGKLKKTLINSKFLNSGNNQIMWDGKDEFNSYVNNGQYICLITSEQNDSKIEKKLIFSISNKQNHKTGCIITQLLQFLFR